MRKPTIETARLKLVPYELKHFEAILNDPGKLAELLGATVFENWFVFPGVAGIEAIRYGYEHLKANPDILGWWTYLFVHIEDNALIGHGGFKGKPDEAGMVELGYALVPAYRGRGLATEAAQGLMDYAFSDPRVKTVDAHTLAEPNPSTRVLDRLGLKQVDTVQDPDVGDVWHWRMNRDQFVSEK